MTENQSLHDSENISLEYSETGISNVGRFWFFIIFDIPSILCTLVIIFYIVTDRKVRSSLKNHSLIVTLILGLSILTIDVPLYINFILKSTVLPAFQSTCLIWVFVDCGMFNGTLLLMSWMSFERHILVYHDQWIATKKGRICLHYLPLLILILYIFIFYIYATYYYPCENIYDYSSAFCNIDPCYCDDPGIGMWDVLVNSAIPSFLEALFSLSFLFRFICHRYHSNLRISWGKQRKMAIQLMAISLLNFVTVLPPNIILVAHLLGLPEDIGSNISSQLFFFSYLISFVFPFICLASMTGMKQKLQTITHAVGRKFKRKPVSIQPMRLTTNTLRQY